MAKTEKAEAGSASSTPAEDKKTAKAASAKLDKTRGKAPTAREAENAAMDAKNEPEDLGALPLEEIARRATVAERRTASPTQQNPSAEYDETFKVTKEESNLLKRYLAKVRADKAAEAGETPQKAFLVNDSGSDRVRWGGVTYRVPEGRNELTDEFVAEHFPDGITADDLKKGLLGGRVKVEYDAVEPKGKAVVKPKSATKSASKAKK